jgi:hypothetical protein
MFQFSQSSLQDYCDCPRRFELRYVLHCAWPALDSEPILESERHRDRGQAFHRLAHQHALGIPDTLLSAAATQAGLDDWWASFLADAPGDLPGDRRAEVALAAPLAGHTLAAKYDLVVIASNRLAILDWKTNLRRPSRTALEYRLQSRVYPYVLAASGSQLSGGAAVVPSDVEMTYWFAEFPGRPETFRYSADAYAADARYLGGLITEIAGRPRDTFPLATDPRRCRFCVYRSLCERDVEAASYEDEEFETQAPVEAQISLEQIAEIAY